MGVYDYVWYKTTCPICGEETRESKKAWQTKKERDLITYSVFELQKGDTFSTDCQKCNSHIRCKMKSAETIRVTVRGETMRKENIYEEATTEMLKESYKELQQRTQRLEEALERRNGSEHAEL